MSSPDTVVAPGLLLTVSEDVPREALAGFREEAASALSDDAWAAPVAAWADVLSPLAELEG